MEKVRLEALIVNEERFQMRADIPSVEEYCEVIEQGNGEWPFPPIIVAKIRKQLLLVEGFTRVRAARKQGLEEVPAEVVATNAKGAMRLALAANATHGYRRTAADRRKAVLRAKGEFPEFSNRKLAELCKVSPQTVGRVLKEATGQDPGEEPEADGSILGEDCPVCGVDQWADGPDGIHCFRCGHVQGEAVGIEESESYEDPEGGEDAERSAVKKKIEKSRTDLRSILRELEELKPFSKAELAAFTVMLAAIDARSPA